MTTVRININMLKDQKRRKVFLSIDISVRTKKVFHYRRDGPVDIEIFTLH